MRAVTGLRVVGTAVWLVANLAPLRPRADDKVGFLAEQLSDSSFKVRLKAAVLLGRLDDSRAVSPLVSALRDENYVVRGAAARALGNLGHPLAVSAVEPLLQLIRDEETFVRNEAVSALGRLAGDQSLDHFISALSHEDPQIRVTAVHMLAGMRFAEARAAIVPALGDADEEVRAEAMVSVRGLAQTEMQGLLLQALGRRDNYLIQSTAARLLGELKVNAATGPLADLLVSDEVVPEVKKEAAEAIAGMKSQMDVKLLVTQLNSPDRATQDRAIKLLGIHGGPDAVDALLAQLKHPDAFVRRQVVFALGDSGDPRAITALEYQLKTEDNPRFRELIERTLRKLRP